MIGVEKPSAKTEADDIPFKVCDESGCIGARRSDAIASPIGIGAGRGGNDPHRSRIGG